MVTVIMAVRNGGREMLEQLEALAAQQTTVPYELIVADNGSTDGSPVEARRFGETAPMPVIVLTAREFPGKGWAIRRAVDVAANGDAFAICDADDVADPGWLQGLVGGLINADAVGGRLDTSVINSLEAQAMKSWSALPESELPRALHKFPFFVGANCALWREVYEAVGGWDAALTPAGDDVDICIRLAERGYKLDFAPDAVMHYRLRPERRAAVRQAFSYGKADPELVRRYRHLGARGDGLKETAVFYRHALPQSFGALLRGDDPHHSLPITAYKLGRLVGTLQHRTICL